MLKDIYLDIEISAGYFLTLTVANLIALSGLITGSIAVIIGAMLISPLMGPILSLGFAFITGDRAIWRKSVKKISISIVATIIIAAFATVLSPFKEITNEIIVRTRPNLYDLIIALLAGSAGAVAICTKKQYLTIVPGVAIATAVIPPLSVTGFGVGIWDLRIALGGFALFFTNFVAILISTCLVIYVYGFRPSHIEEADMSLLKRRISFLAFVLLIISVPLIYTVYRSLTEVRLRSDIKNVLQMEFDRQDSSHLDTFAYARDKSNKLQISATVKVVSYLKEPEIDAMEKNVAGYLKRDVGLRVEQILVKPGGLKEHVNINPAIVPPAVAPAKQPEEIIRRSREDILSVIRQSAERVDKAIFPSKVADFSVAFDDKTSRVSLILKIQRDEPLTAEETGWLKGLFAADLNTPVDVSVETVPLVPLLIFKKGETEVSQEMKKAIMAIRDVYASNPHIEVVVVSYTGSPVGSVRRLESAEKRGEQVTAVLEKECGISPGRIRTTVRRSGKIEAPVVKITVERGDNK